MTFSVSWWAWALTPWPGAWPTHLPLLLPQVQRLTCLAKGKKQSHNEITPQSLQGTCSALGCDSHPHWSKVNEAHHPLCHTQLPIAARAPFPELPKAQQSPKLTCQLSAP